jgi:hypothetical protein
MRLFPKSHSEVGIGVLCMHILAASLWSGLSGVRRPARGFQTDLVSTSQSKIPATVLHLSQQHRAKEQRSTIPRMHEYLPGERKTDRSIPFQPAASSHGAARCKTKSTNMFLEKKKHQLHSGFTLLHRRHAMPHHHHTAKPRQRFF